MAEFFQLSEHEKFIFLERSLDDLARQHVQSELNIDTYEDLKCVLLVEFVPKVSTEHIHNLLLRSGKCRFRKRYCDISSPCMQLQITSH